MERDAFPATHLSWIHRQLAAGSNARPELHRFLMEVYSLPLQVYYRGTRMHWLGDPDEVVHGFFAERLARPGFLDAWRQSNKPLRRWLMNAFCFYLQECRRARQAQPAGATLATDPPAPDVAMEREADREFVVGLVRAALRRAEYVCGQRGQAEHWRLFVAHHLDQRPYAELEAEFGIAPPRASVMVRTATHCFRAVLRGLIERDGVEARAVDRVIADLLAATES